MSQVIVTKDQLQVERDRSGVQERKIDREVQFDRWRRNDVTAKDPILRLIGYAVLPVVALWAILYALSALALNILKWVFKSLGKVIGGTKSLITGR